MEGKLEKKGSLSDVKTEKRVYPVDESQYRLLEEVGRGASAVVYRAECIPFNEYVAIKSLDLERCNSNLNDIHREAKTMSLINHPNVVKAYCSFVVDHSLWVVMPYMAGGSCLHIMKSAYPDGFEEPIIASFLKETLKALDYLHTQGHIHRDVKAGNILVDGSGAVKLGDFGVSACMFDTGDRQRARNTFVGTPCWMAPEVMEQIHGYDFKADIWSFGITALELAHGHAPFSKFPPMKVLLMTLQNPPPGLDYARDRRFSKSFKEMIAMCLVKDPAKRPTAEKLLKHSFFKSARSAEYVARTILSPLPPLWERVNDLKIKDADRLAQKKMPYGEQEERSQNEYKRGVSAWNFDLEDLKAQAALGDGEPFSGMAEKLDSDFQEAIEALSPTLCFEHEPDVLLHSTKICSIKSEAALDSGEQSMHGLSGPLQVNGLSEIGTNTQALDESMRSPKLKEKPFNGPLASATTTVDANLSSNGLNQSKASIAQKDEEKLKGPLVQKKGRFSVTSHELESQEGSQATNTRRNASAQTSALHKSSSVNEGLLERKNVQVPTLGPSQSFSGLSSGMNAVSVIPQLQNLFNQTAIQQELIMNLMSTINPSGDQYVEKYNCMSIEVILYRSAKKTLLHRLQI
ncbi:hypothetical protein KP509_31G052000 [Ceratopteris richardii]|uniref:Protein kinase domain-containing protein n=1 Tax=Ceratopteris richardii TaxID=49495 RepID=A0A8T2R064_CERRI|nr:hypothetical protein KP509_31G052000 [Ceratopteris richardii]